ncbi:putative ras of Complex, Roc, domain of DAPkinase [Lyophyllum shimeji]|uniref:Ras of Complex, Roc, domain of DAPkinase n=1 Tax=Lyophyllum shimeji TaxID=47721 RepID=A0A9P3Q116_LYOSH|nr:putative ras of Complex, Roc, domain of DAPkinase [Lyophyllum shimeji]
MPTVKLVVIGASGVGKTSLRGQYISGRFTNGYRATIGADFITKTLPHPSNPADTVTLQIWDTAGQERFSSLSSAFFRGADAALLMFDVNTPETMTALTKWWAEFRERAPLADEDVEDYCCVVVGNKTDLVGSGGRNGEGPVTEAEAHEFLSELIPLKSRSPSPIYPSSLQDELSPEVEMDACDDPLASSQVTIRRSSPPSPPQTRSDSIAILPNGHHPASSSSPLLSYSPKHRLSKSRSRSSSHFYSGTMTTTHTTLTIYHTPSSSLFDVYQSARSSPEPWSSPSSSSSASSSAHPRRQGTTRKRRSTGSASSESAATITPSRFAREHASSSASLASQTAEDHHPAPDLSASTPFPLPPPPARGPRLFFTSAKTGEGVADVFEYIAARVVRRWEYEERVDARRMHLLDEGRIMVGVGQMGGVRGKGVRVVACC